MHLAMPIAKGRSAPDLALAYHSQQSYGSLGVGWSFSAGSIVRNKARGIDYSSKDFLLSLGSSLVDLVNVEDDLYRDKQGDLRIEAQYDPASDSWVVFDSFGTKYAFGSAHGSRLSGAGGTIQWSLDRVEDLSGNYSELTYRKAEGELNLTSLLFSGNSRSQLQPRNKVDITYEAQPHEAIATSYVGGIHVTNSIRIRQIRITANGHLYATYSLKYRSSQETARSLLVGVTREAGPFSSSIDFAYSDKIKSDSWARAQVTGPTRTATIYSQCLMGDFDGEGKADLACALDTSGKWQVGISKGASDNGNWTQIKQKYDGFNVGVWPGPVVNKQTTIDIPFSGPNIFAPDKKVNIADVRTTCLTGDFNGDSKTDIACYNSSDGSWNVGLSNGHGFDVSVWRNGPVMAGGAGGDKPLTDRCVVGDFDGDGKTDIACLVSPTASSDEGKWSIALSTGHGWKTSVWTGSSPTGPSEKVADACVAADFNGDRRQDIACYGATDHVWHVAISTGTTFRSSVWANGPAIVGDLGPQAVVPSHCVVGDFNGDGNADIACYTGTSGSEEFDGKWSMGFSTGSGWNTVEWLGPPVPTSKNDGWVVANQCITGDFNGDGRTDIACNYGGDPKYSTPFAKANGDCPDKPLAQRAAAGCHLVLVWGASLSTGSGFASSLFSPVGSVALRSTAWGLPWASCVAADFTGDGKSDLLCDWGIQSDQYVLNISDFQPTDVLTEVREPLGLKGQFSYGFSSFEKGSELGFSLPVLKRSLFSDGLTATAANYTYSGGAYFKAANRFRGFHQTRITHHDDSATRRLLEVLSFHQGDGLAPDQDSARDVTGLTVGKLYRRMLQGRQKRTLLTTLLEYQLEPTTIANQKAPRLVRETTGISSSTGPVRKSTALSYDEAGNVSDIVIASGNEPDSLETHEHLSYSNDSEAHAFGFPLLRELSDNQFGALERTAYSYDTAACNNPAQGTRLWQLTGVKRWLSADISAEEKYSRSASGNVTCYEDALGNQTVATFDDQDEYMSKITDPLNHTVAFRYYGVDSEAPGATAGLVSSRTNASGDTAQFFYDVFGRLRMVINPDASSVKISYHNFGDPKNQSILSESSAALVSKQLMDGYGRRYVFSESAPQGKAVGFAASYDKNGELERIGAPAVLPSLNDKPSRKTIQYEMKRDELGRVVSLRDARRVLKRSCYDGLRAARLDANGSGWVDTFDVFGNRVATEEYVQKFDDCNRVLQYRQSSSGSGAQQTGVTTTLYKFDALNRVRQVARQGKVLTSIAYDGLGNATSVMNVDRGTSRYSYDKSGRLKRSQPDSTRTIELSRDALGRVTEVFSVGEDDKRSLLEAFTYDQGPHASGLITAGEAQGVRTALSYDTMGRVTHEVDSADGHDFDLKLAYDALGRVDDITYPDGMQIQNRYEGSMLATVESERQTFAQLESFNGYLEPTSLLLGNGLRETRAYGDSDPRSNRDNASCKSVPASYLCLISATGSDDSDRFGLTYRYDATGNVVQIDDATLGGTSFSYDSLDRLTAEMGSVASGRPDVKYNYDQFGRRASASDEGAYQYRDASVAFSAPSEVGHISSSYDEGGRRQTYGEENYKFDAFGRLSEVRMPAQKMSVRYRYDAFGDVISRKLDVNSRSEEVYFVSGYAECVQAASNAGVKCRDLIYGPTGLMAGLRSGDAGVGLGRESEYYHLDRNGTIRFITDQSGSSTARLSYSAFGIPELQGSAQNSLPGRTRSLDQYYYAGHRWDPNSGLYYFGARFYDPRIGQFLSPDTDAIIASGGINTYTYARNNPNRWIDPDGKDVGGSGGFSGSMSMTINIGGGPNMSGFSGSGPSFSASPNISFNFGGPGVGHGSLFVGGPEVPAFSGSNATLAPLEQNQVAAGGLTNFVGIAGAVVTPVGGGGIGVGFYSDSYGMVGAYLSVAPEAGLPGGSLGITAGSSHSFAGESISASWGGGYGALGASRGYSISPSTGEVTGEQWSAGLAFGPPVAASVGYSSTQTTEFTSLYLAYIQFLNWIGYPSFR
jgi:RHS repeat-associated protein